MKMSRKDAMLAQCWECQGHYVDGHDDCENTRCSLYHWMPYRKMEPDLGWTAYWPLRTGLVLKKPGETPARIRTREINLRAAQVANEALRTDGATKED